MTTVDHVGAGCTDGRHVVNLVLEVRGCTSDASKDAPRRSAPGAAGRSVTTLVLLGVWILTSVASAGAQAPEPPPAGLPEDLQPRLVGSRGTTSVGIAGFVERFVSPDQPLPTTYLLQVDAGHFVTRRIVVRGGLAGTGRIGGDEAEDADPSPDGRALHAFGGALVHMTPRSMASLYLGTEYWLQVADRAGGDIGMAVARLGLEGAVSSRVGLFVEGGFGLGLRRDREDVRLARIIAQVGMRFKL